MEIVIIQKLLTIVATSTILDAAALLDPSQGFRFIKCLCKTSLYTFSSILCDVPRK